MSDRNQAQAIQSLADLNQILVKHDKVGEVTSLALSITQMLKAPLLDLKCIRLRQKLDILEMYLKELPLAVIQAYTKAQADIQRLLNSSPEPTSRTLKMDKIRDELKSVSVLDTCVRNLVARGIFVRSSKIGQGSFGKVYKSNIAEVSTVLKVVNLERSYDEFDLHELIETAYLTILLEEYQPQEYKLGITLNDLVLTDQCPNFILTYGIGTTKKKAVYFLEEASSDLAEAFKQSSFGLVSQISLLAQLLIALYYVHTRLKVTHNDINATNILLLETPSLARSLMTYEVDGRSFVIENTGVILCLADFGVSEPKTPTNISDDVADAIATLLGGYEHKSYPYKHKGYPNLSPNYKQVLEEAYSTTFLDSLDALTFILDSVKYKPPTDLSVSKVLKSTSQIGEFNKALVRAAIKSDTKAVRKLANQAMQPFLNLALIAAATRGHTNTIDILIDKGANNYEDLILTLAITILDKTPWYLYIGKHMPYRSLNISSSIAFILASSNIKDDMIKLFLQFGPRDHEDLSKLLVAAGLNGSAAAVEVILSEGATNLDQALRAARLTNNQRAIESLKAKGAQENGPLPTLPANSLHLLKTLDNLVKEYDLSDERVKDLADVYERIKEFTEPL